MLFSIAILTFNGEKTIGKLLDRIKLFSKGYKTETIVIDSGSTDQTLKIIKKHKKTLPNLRLHQINNEDFNHGETRNYAAKLAKGKYIIFVTQDVLPKSKNTLGYLIEDFKLHKKAVAVYTKDIPYADTPIIQKLELICRYKQFDKHTNKKGVLIQNPKQPFLPFTEDNKFVWYALSNVFACYRRTFLIKNPFEKTDYGEDLLMGKQIIESGFIKIYDARCAVTHSNILSLAHYYGRQKKDLALRFSQLKLKPQSGLLCKIKLISEINTDRATKLFYLVELGFYYLLKLVAIADNTLLSVNTKR